jgi:hypothetical protein
MINIAHFLAITPKGGTVKRFQNFFYSPSDASNAFAIPGTSSPLYSFAPFSVQGATAQLNGENETLQVLFPFTTFGVRLVEEGDGNRLSLLELKTVWLETNSSSTNPSSYLVSAQYTEFYTGIGASFSDTTIELRFKSAMDSVNAGFPSRSFTRSNVGILPLNADVNLR